MTLQRRPTVRKTGHYCEYQADRRFTVRRPSGRRSTPSRTLVECGKFKKIYDPSVNEKQQWYINDHCFIRAADGTWHMFGIPHPEPAKPSDEVHFAHATAKSPLQQPWQEQPFALDVARNAPWNETHLWAPYVVFHHGLYYMYYSAGGSDPTKSKIHLATSTDLKSWTRSPHNPMVVDGYDTRDPFVLRLGRHWVMYYTATSRPQGGNHIVATESPFVVQGGNSFYLFIGPRGGYDGTDVFVSSDPFHWKLEDKVGHFAAHAAEIVQDTDGKWYISRAGWGRGGLYLAPLLWKDGMADR